MPGTPKHVDLVLLLARKNGIIRIQIFEVYKFHNCLIVQIVILEFLDIYSGTPLRRTPLGKWQVSFMWRCPYLRGFLIISLNVQTDQSKWWKKMGYNLYGTIWARIATQVICDLYYTTQSGTTKILYLYISIKTWPDYSVFWLVIKGICLFYSHYNIEIILAGSL